MLPKQARLDLLPWDDFIRVAFVLAYAIVQLIALNIRQGQSVRFQALPEAGGIKSFGSRCRRATSTVGYPGAKTRRTSIPIASRIVLAVQL